MNTTAFRIYPDGDVVQEDDFEEYDLMLPTVDDFAVHDVPDEIIEYITGDTK